MKNGISANFWTRFSSRTSRQPGNSEILVADGLSDDGTRDLLQQYSERDSRVRMIDNPGRIVSTGLNAAIGAASGDVIIRMDAHTTYARDYIRECINALRESGADNVGGPWVAEGRRIRRQGHRYGLSIPLLYRRRQGARCRLRWVKLTPSICGCWYRSVFTRIGMFDPDLVRNQDDEFNFRLRRTGGRVWQ